MHVLVLPTEQYCPDHEPLAGIFQRHQIEALRATGQDRLGVVSVRMRHSVPMYLKTLAFRLAGRRLDNELAPIPTRKLPSEVLRRWSDPFATLCRTELDGVPVIRSEGLYGTAPHPMSDAIWWQRAGWSGVVEYIERHGRPDLIHAHNALPAGLLAAKVRRKLGIPYVLSEHSSSYQQNKIPNIWFGALRRAFKQADAVMPVSAALWETVEAKLGPMGLRPRIVGNVLPPFFAATPPVRRASMRKPVCVCVASLLDIKNHCGLLEAFARLRRRFPDAVLRLLGDGPLRGRLEARAAEPDLFGSVMFLGVGDQQRVRDEMDAADLLVFPSHFETFGVVLIEAMARGRPVVAMRSGGPAEIVDDVTGRLVDPGDPAALADAIAAILENGNTYDPMQIRARTEARWGADAFCGRLREVYSDAVPAGLPREGAFYGASA